MRDQRRYHIGVLQFNGAFQHKTTPLPPLKFQDFVQPVVYYELHPRIITCNAYSSVIPLL